MNKKIMILFALLLLIAACGDDAVSDNQTVAAPALQANLSTCPEVTCPLCEECETCPESDCVVDSDHMELSLDGIQLLQYERGQDEDVTVAKLAFEQLDNLKKTSITFKAECDESPGKLKIRIGNDAIYEAEPMCNQQTSFDFDQSILEFGRNNIVFKTDGDVDYTIDGILLNMTYDNGSSEAQNLFEVSFVPSDGQRTNLDNLEDVDIKNYAELEVDLNKEDLDEDLILTFNGNQRDGILTILVNEKELFSSEVQRHLNEVTIPKEYLREGTNYLTFVGTSK